MYVNLILHLHITNSSLALTTGTSTENKIYFSSMRVSYSGTVYVNQLTELYPKGDIVIDYHGAIRADGSGYPPMMGPSPGTNGAGGAHGGYGGGSSSSPQTTVTYGDLNAPVTMGSGGSDEPGGGAVYTVMCDQPQLVDDGAISSNGLTSNGGGAGGSVFIEAGSLIGYGTISANGGNGETGGGGGGGRISISECTDVVFPLPPLTVQGGSSNNALYFGSSGSIVISKVPSLFLHIFFVIYLFSHRRRCFRNLCP